MSVVRRASSQLLSARSVHLRIVPRPSNLGESREIYRVLQRYGEIDVFKWLKVRMTGDGRELVLIVFAQYEYHNPLNNIALAIFRNDAAAQRALDASPIRFALEKTVAIPIEDAQFVNDVDEQDTNEDTSNDSSTDTTPSDQSPKDTIDDILRPSTLSTRTIPTTKPQPTTPSPSSPTNLPYSPAPSQSTTTIPTTQTKHFQIIIDHSYTVHADFVSRQPYWKYFAPMKSMAQTDLAKKVPHIGLSDVSKRPPNAHRTPNKVLRDINEWLDRGMPRIRDLVEERDGDGEGSVTGGWSKTKGRLEIEQWSKKNWRTK